MTDFVYDGLNPVREATGGTTVDLLTGLGINEYLTRTTGGTTEHYLTDALGSVVALADGAGAVASTYSYEPFGRVTATGSTSSNELKYTGREDDATGLHYYRARYYHPQLQRFISEDPIEFDAGDVNLYVYVGNSPMDRTDPLGLFGIEDLPTIPAPVVNTVAGFGDAFLIPILVRSALDIDDVVDRCSAEYRGGMVGGIVVGSIPFVLRGAAALGGTRIGHILNHNRYLRIGPGRMKAPFATDAARLSVGHRGVHVDLRSRLPYVPPIGLAGRKSC
ncbi:MAG TPA: RHS repeat-associated core domain-containing protein [Candidatus Tectomicrobia bacterium]|nr:RHS repeat-associated core domain-containing protein [Candidatus Tectomicrobia bacterium]